MIDYSDETYDEFQARMMAEDDKLAAAWQAGLDAGIIWVNELEKGDPDSPMPINPFE